jgi:dihydrofolate synthase/folylpolyglutamate synthase
VSGRIEPIVARLHDLHPRLIDLSLDRLQRLLATLGHPERKLPPVLHVAGTNGKGSTCAFLRAMGEAAGLRVHVYTSPHLVHFRERFRVAGALVTEDALADAMEELEQANAGLPITVFEMITAVAFHLFAQAPADLCVLEVGLGGRGDATNVIVPAATAVTSISLDHREMLGDTLAAIAAEKAGIFKPGVPAVTGAQPAEAIAVLVSEAAARGANLLARDRDWTIEPDGAGLRFEDHVGVLHVPAPSLPGLHQVDNAGIALATLRSALLGLPHAALTKGIAQAEWPARLQRLTGRLSSSLEPSAAERERAAQAGWEVWLDGGHNPGAGVALAAHLATWRDRPIHLVVGMKQAKDSAEFLRPLLPYAATLWAVAEPGQHLALPVEAIIAASGGVARPGPTVAGALQSLALHHPPGRVLICGSLYLAGEVLKLDAA